MRRVLHKRASVSALLGLVSCLASACAMEVSLVPPSADGARPTDATDEVDAPSADGAAVDAAIDAAVDVDPALTRGAAVFRQFCAHCHGARGAGTGDGPDLRREVPASPDDEIRRILLVGGRRMPVVPVDDAQRGDVFLYLRATFGEYRGR